MYFPYYVAFKLMASARYKWTLLVKSWHQLSAVRHADIRGRRSLLLLWNGDG
jgi:hypothetical protein